jgi:hypothetical protein
MIIRMFPTGVPSASDAQKTWGQTLENLPGVVDDRISVDGCSGAGTVTLTWRLGTLQRFGMMHLRLSQTSAPDCCCVSDVADDLRSVFPNPSRSAAGQR